MAKYRLWFGVALIVFALDQLTKWIVTGPLHLREVGQIYLLPIAGGEGEKLTDLPIAIEDLIWFPDGKRIAFVASTWPDLNGDFAAVKKRLVEEGSEIRLMSPAEFGNFIRAENTRWVKVVKDEGIKPQ